MFLKCFNYFAYTARLLYCQCIIIYTISILVLVKKKDKHKKKKKLVVGPLGKKTFLPLPTIQVNAFPFLPETIKILD